MKGKNLAHSTYEKELLALAVAVKKWRPYLLGRPFVIKTNHQSLKYLLEHKIGTPTQQKWITKLFAYAFIPGQNVPAGFTLCNDLLFYKGRLYLEGSAQNLKAIVLRQIHASPLGGHSGYLKSFHRLKKDFYWTGMVRDLK